eukprot:1141155-Amphidinium_carterae.1
MEAGLPLAQLTTSLRRVGRIFEMYPYNISTGLHGQGGHAHRRDHHLADENAMSSGEDRDGWGGPSWQAGETDPDGFYFGGPRPSDSGDEYQTSTEASMEGGADAESYLSSSIVGNADPNNAEWLYLQYTGDK